jgi:hypothetical protein
MCACVRYGKWVVKMNLSRRFLLKTGVALATQAKIPLMAALASETQEVQTPKFFAPVNGWIKSEQAAGEKSGQTQIGF